MPEDVKDLHQGTDYHFFAADRFTPSPGQAPPLKDNLKNYEPWGWHGDTPYDFIKWFDDLWHKGDPTRWGDFCFTSDAVMIDSTGTSSGGKQAASDFELLFKYFPTLRGEVVSWGNNDTEIFINWRFVVSKDRLVPVIDKFSFVKGRVSFRMAYFDTITFLSYLAENHGSGPLIDYFMERFSRAGKGLGILFAPGLLWALLKGLFVWSPIPLAAPRGLTATPEDGGVRLTWGPVPGAGSYTVKRSEVRGGPYPRIAPPPPVLENSYLDRTARPGAQYYYVVSANPPGDAVILPEPKGSPS